MIIKIIKQHEQLEFLGINLGTRLEVIQDKGRNYLTYVPHLKVNVNIPKEYCEVEIES